MNPAPPRDPAIAFALFTVCASGELLSAAMAAADESPQAFFAGEFRDYLPADKRPQFSQPIKEARACLALVNFDRDPELALLTTERLNQIFQNRIGVVGVGAAPGPELLLHAVRAGCVDFLPCPVQPGDLPAAIERFQKSSIFNPLAQPSTGRVLAFFGAKGGVGTTTLAVHLANYLVTRHAKKTLLIDHKHQLGHVALYLGLKDTQYHFDELLGNVDRLDAELLNGFAIRHASGLDVMASPEVAAAAREGDGEALARVMDFLRSEYEYVLIDSSMDYQETKMSIIDESDEVYLVSTPDVAALRDLARLVELIGLSPGANGKLRLLVNRSTANDSLTSSQIETAVRFPVSHTVPNNYGQLLRAINRGVPVSSHDTSGFNLAMGELAAKIVHGDAPGAAKPAAPARTSRLLFWK